MVRVQYHCRAWCNVILAIPAVQALGSPPAHFHSDRPSLGRPAREGLPIVALPPRISRGEASSSSSHANDNHETSVHLLDDQAAPQVTMPLSGHSLRPGTLDCDYSQGRPRSPPYAYREWPEDEDVKHLECLTGIRRIRPPSSRERERAAKTKPVTALFGRHREYNEYLIHAHPQLYRDYLKERYHHYFSVQKVRARRVRYKRFRDYVFRRFKESTAGDQMKRPLSFRTWLRCVSPLDGERQLLAERVAHMKRGGNGSVVNALRASRAFQSRLGGQIPDLDFMRDRLGKDAFEEIMSEPIDEHWLQIANLKSHALNPEQCFWQAQHSSPPEYAASSNTTDADPFPKHREMRPETTYSPDVRTPPSPGFFNDPDIRALLDELHK